MAEWFLDEDASGSGDGKSWKNAWTTLQQAYDEPTYAFGDRIKCRGSLTMAAYVGTVRPTRRIFVGVNADGVEDGTKFTLDINGLNVGFYFTSGLTYQSDMFKNFRFTNWTSTIFTGTSAYTGYPWLLDCLVDTGSSILSVGSGSCGLQMWRCEVKNIYSISNGTAVTSTAVYQSHVYNCSYLTGHGTITFQKCLIHDIANNGAYGTTVNIDNCILDGVTGYACGATNLYVSSSKITRCGEGIHITTGNAYIWDNYFANNTVDTYKTTGTIWEQGPNSFGNTDDGYVDRAAKNYTPTPSYLYRRELLNIPNPGSNLLYGTRGISGADVIYPKIDSLSAIVGPMAGGTVVRLTSSNGEIALLSSVTVNSKDAPITPVDSNHADITMPANNAGLYDIVANFTGYSSYTITNGFTYQAGASAPGAPTISLVESLTNAVTLAIVPPEGYEAIDIYRDGIILPAGEDISNPVLFTDNTVDEGTEYAYTAKARNSTGTSATSNVITTTTPTGLAGTDSKLEEIENAIIALIDGIDKVGGYFYDWGATNEPDFAKKTAFPCADVFVSNEENNDDFNTGHSGAYANATVFEIHVFSKLEVECDNPQFEINKSLNKALEDLKKLFGTYDNVNDTCNAIYYSGMIREYFGNGNIVTTGKMITKWTVHYTQSRINPQINAN